MLFVMQFVMHLDDNNRLSILCFSSGVLLEHIAKLVVAWL